MLDIKGMKDKRYISGLYFHQIEGRKNIEDIIHLRQGTS